jgi:hypothetical protein
MAGQSAMADSKTPFTEPCASVEVIYVVIELSEMCEAIT